MKINLIAVGSLSSDNKKIYDSYIKKISFLATINLIEIKEVVNENIEIKIAKETELILNKIPKNSKVIYLSLKGKQMTSEEFSDLFIEDNLTFIVGGSNGVDESKFNNKISFSKMTFPHQMFRLMLIEQIYRGLAIKKNIKYHK
ncbi:Ribosomal RNA large subunit methyltransferase H [Mycoplasmopsis arginini]|uniref:23S rRNA (pseudouridine(1915)-N(3))-methyltransferase RlmH n=1 Tax=Mycoplasmopsis arginini TaxID=2094 RepID=UPI000A27EB60|nr:23S rRNA (pseudouridine(1915)-N(3))-methyltransferase RlmH [Mycoplasmopsis arginini]SGA02265.1 Ribosomal RNA large subunit methyltransferase H [Chlamydia abortus]PWC09042.1 23S rRNA (pseudouridine(1915)-N(3))-methyltransferase RlmH [Mycoplasmopsis arginini]SGA07413.1 Ribosomal RNA large subunit methyltransferase H [Mycoplasmopsis arginini]SGA09632.1 Ribosomal RNA large subunit methyltransferase H [Mycoplasmopsis arginini]SGA32075.1 Ribosomal RNA large subunit methyltransferase H [Chlamydia 